VGQLKQLYERTALSASAFAHRPFTRIKQLQHLLAEGRIDPEFYWRG
jgi:hypothetical protein